LVLINPLSRGERRREGCAMDLCQELFHREGATKGESREVEKVSGDCSQRGLGDQPMASKVHVGGGAKPGIQFGQKTVRPVCPIPKAHTP